MYRTDIAETTAISIKCIFSCTYELPATQWAAVTTQSLEIKEPPQINLP